MDFMQIKSKTSKYNYPKTWLLPPEAGPMPQGLNINYNTVKTVKLEKINGRQDRQGSSKRAEKNS